MSKSEKRIKKMRTGTYDVRFQELCQLYADHGVLVEPGCKHFLAKLPGTPIKRTFPRQNPMKRPYVDAALAAIEEAEALGL